jgi:16S rRNA (cytidine1402-2'-O)-methyltransferase
MLTDPLPQPGTLHVVATPIGNLEDLSPRALRTLREADLVACEDTRHTAALLRRHGIVGRMISYFEHNERSRTGRILEELRSGRSVALVCDAGTPGISDPGYRLVRAARQADIPVVPVPGPSAAVAALSVSGLPTDRFLFVGFLPSRTGPRRRALLELADVPWTLVFYESPVRILDTLTDAIATFGDRDAFLCREATKLHEEYLGGRLSALRESLAAREGGVRGEIVLVVEGVSGTTSAAIGRRFPGEDDAVSPEALFARLSAEGRTRREAVKEVARRLGLPAREVYRRVLEAKSGEGDSRR